MPFPITWRWTIQVPRGSRDAETEIEALADALRREGAKSVVSRQPELEFDCPGITGMNRWALLAPISGGSIAVSAREHQMHVTYSLRFDLVFWASLLFAGVFSLLSMKSDPLKVGVLAFSWLFFGNIVISLYRFPKFLRRVLTDGSPPNTSLERTRGR